MNNKYGHMQKLASKLLVVFFLFFCSVVMIDAEESLPSKIKDSNVEKSLLPKIKAVNDENYIQVSNLTPILLHKKLLSKATIDQLVEEEHSKFMKYRMYFTLEWKPEFINKFHNNYRLEEKIIIGFVEILKDGNAYERIEIDENYFFENYLSTNIVFQLPIKELNRFHAVPHVFVNSSYVAPNSYKQKIYQVSFHLRLDFEDSESRLTAPSPLSIINEEEMRLRLLDNPFRRLLEEHRKKRD